MAKRGRPRKNPLPDNEKTQNNLNENNTFIKDFAKDINTPYLDSILGQNWMMNPYWMNSILKDAEGYPIQFKRDDIVKALADPVNNEKKLRQMHLQLYHTNLFYKRVIKYFATIPIFRGYIQPEGVTRADIKSSIWQTKYQKCVGWLRDFDLAYEFRLVIEHVLGEDADFCYLRKSENGYNFQHMPYDWCKIVRKCGNYYQYAFNLMYFLRPGTLSVDDFDPFFKQKLEELLEGKTEKDIQMLQYLWVELPPDIAPCFKFNEITPVILPTFCGAFLDILSIMEYKDLIKSKAKLDATQILTQKIPIRTDKEVTKNDPFLIDGNASKFFHKSVKASLPDGGEGTVRLVTSPMEIDSINLTKTDNKDNLIGYATNEYYKTIGSTETIFNADSSASGIAVLKSIMNDEAFILDIFKPLENFLNVQLKKQSGKYSIKFKFAGLTYYNQDDKLKLYLAAGQMGMPKSLAICAAGYNTYDTPELTAFEEEILGVDDWKPFNSSFVQSGKDDSGAPNKGDNVSDSTIEGRDAGSNVNKGTGKV